MRLFAKLSISFFLVLIFSFPGKGINPLYTREIPPETPFAVPPSISVFQDPETGNIVSQQLGEIKILINKNPTPSPEVIKQQILPPAISPTLKPVERNAEIETPIPSPEKEMVPLKKNTNEEWKCLGSGLTGSFQSEFSIQEKNIRTLQISDLQFILFRSKYLLNQNDSNRMKRIIETVIRFIHDQGDNIPNQIPLNVNGTLWTVTINEDELIWGVDNIQEEILADPLGSRYYVIKRYYYDFQQRIIAVAQISDIPHQKDEIETKPWTAIVLNSPFQTLVEYAQNSIQ